MKNNDFVAMGKLQCPICGEIHSHEAPVLVHKRLRKIKEDDTLCGMGMCKTHKKQADEGFIHICEVANGPSEDRDRLSVHEAKYTGRTMAIKEHVLRNLLANVNDDTLKNKMIYVDTPAFDYLLSLIPE